MPDQPPPAPALTTADIRHIARLACLSPTDAQIADYQTNLAAVLGYVGHLRTLDLAGVAPLATPLPTTGPMDPDEPGQMLPPATLLKMAPATDGPFIAVPKVLGESEGGGGA